MVENFHPLGPQAFAEARGQSSEIPEEACQKLNEGQEALLEIALYKLRVAGKILAAEAAYNQQTPEVEYPDRTKFNPNYTEDSVVLGGCTE